MRAIRSKWCALPLMSALVMGGLTLTAAAGGSHDRVYADSFGNLVIQSPAGYKRIVVGGGHLAEQLSHFERTGEEHADVSPGPVRLVRDAPCFRPPVLVKGRSYMYGFDEGEIPLLGGPCH